MHTWPKFEVDLSNGSYCDNKPFSFLCLRPPKVGTRGILFSGHPSVRPSVHAPSLFRSHENLRIIWWINFNLGSCMHMGGTMIWIDFGVMRLKVKVTDLTKYIKMARSHDNLGTVWLLDCKLGSYMNTGRSMIWLDSGVMRLKVKVTKFKKYIKMAHSCDNFRSMWLIKFELGSCMHMGGTMIWLDFGVSRSKVIMYIEMVHSPDNSTIWRINLAHV